MGYDQQILKILSEVGERGISVQSIAKHVYNMNLSFFFTPDYEEIRTYVQTYLLRNSKSSKSLVERTGRRGFYRLNTAGSADALQLMLKFSQEQQEQEVQKEEEEPRQDLSLDLFEGMI